MECDRRALADELFLLLECSYVACVCDEFAHCSRLGAPYWSQYSSKTLAELLAHPGFAYCALPVGVACKNYC